MFAFIHNTNIFSIMIHRKGVPMKPEKRSMKIRILALIGVMLLVIAVIVSLLVAILDNSPSGWLFGATLAASLTLPVLLWIYTWIYKKIKEQRDTTDDK
jgi:membrane protein YdbS with pleckstrin-like domain